MCIHFLAKWDELARRAYRAAAQPPYRLLLKQAFCLNPCVYGWRLAFYAKLQPILILQGCLRCQANQPLALPILRPALPAKVRKHMRSLDRVNSFFRNAPNEQVLGYSPSELNTMFGGAELPPIKQQSDYPPVSILEPAGIQAYYSCFIMDKADVVFLQRMIDERLLMLDERLFNELAVTHFQHRNKNEHLLFCVSDKEFNCATIRLVTNSSEILSLLSETKFAVPPPWVVFEGYEASWWGGDMQGAQGFYNDNYFFPFFSTLNPAERSHYYAKYSASEVWIHSLELTLDNE